MRGTMLWFNLDKDLGVITTDDGERLGVAGPAFVDGVRPKLRCGGTVVEFQVADVDGEQTAVDVAFVPEVSPRRARRRSRAHVG
jgi:cold shock CspA family protein